MTSQRYENHWSVELPAALADPLTARRRAFLWERVAAPAGRPLALLDCGAGDGGLVAEARARGFESVGLEISGTAIERARGSHPEIDLRRHSVEELPWPVESGAWDVVASFEVIEHLLEPRALLHGARDALVDGGALFVSTPYHGLLKNLAIAAFRFDQHFGVDGEHVRFFTDRALRRLLDECGFTTVELAHLGRFPPLWANTLVSARKR